MVLKLKIIFLKQILENIFDCFNCKMSSSKDCSRCGLLFYVSNAKYRIIFQLFIIFQLYSNYSSIICWLELCPWFTRLTLDCEVSFLFSSTRLTISNHICMVELSQKYTFMFRETTYL